MSRKIYSLALLTGSLMLSFQASADINGSLVKHHKYETKIIGGKDAELNAYPFMTGLIGADSTNIDPFCGASYVGGRYVLTATHCVEGSDAADVAVWIGGTDVNNPDEGKRVQVAQIYTHESYNYETLNNDIAVLELVEDVEGVTAVNIMTPEMEATLTDGSRLTVIGWGALTAEGDSYPSKLQEVEVPLYNREQCKKEYTSEGATESDITEQMLCAGFAEGGKDSCGGDSGGPLLYSFEGKWYQAGVVSFGNGCAAANSPGVYARVSQFNQWLSAKKAGVSYRQFTSQGYVEKSYKESTVFNVKNVSQQEFNVTKATVSELENIELAEVTDNQCDGKTLAANESCDITVNVATNMSGNGSFKLTIDTDNSVNPQAEMFFSSNTLEEETLDVNEHVGSDTKFVKWWGGGDVNWQAETSKFSQGESAVASGDISHYQSTVLLATIDNDRVSEFNFKYLASSEEGYDKLIVLHNNKSVIDASGTQQTEYESGSITLGTGVDRIAFIYRKDETDEDVIGDDKAYLDEVATVLSNTAPTVKLKRSTISVQEGLTFTVDASGSTDPESDNLTYKWEVVGSSKVTLTSTSSAAMTLTAPSYKDATALTFKVTVTDQYGASADASVSVKITQKPKSGGSFGFFMLPLLLIGLRRFVK